MQLIVNGKPEEIDDRSTVGDQAPAGDEHGRRCGVVYAAQRDRSL